MNLFADDKFVPVGTVAEFLDRHHYLGRARRGMAWADEYGVLVLAPPTSRHLPSRWLELTRWCLTGGKNSGSRQWARVSRWLRSKHSATTVVSYSDPSVGHTGALYRACNWWWAPTWHRVVTPPSGGGSWDGVTRQSVKDRWIFALRRDPKRVDVLAHSCRGSYARRFPWCKYTEPGGADFKAFKELL